jgi:3-phosphoshikimate 1-carboxyvinyltransferase
VRSFTAAPAHQVRGSLTVPGDKSVSHRALMLAGIADGASEIKGFLPSEDCLATLAGMRSLGVELQQRSATEVKVRGVGLRGLKAAKAALDMGNAGTAIRLMTGLLCGQPFESTLIGDASLMKRPMERVAKPLRQMGALVSTDNGTPPVITGGKSHLHGIDYQMPMASAQVKSAILLAALYAEGATTVTAPAVNRDHSERMLESCGVEVQVDGLKVRLNPPKSLANQALSVPGDFSSAAFFIVAGLLGADREGLLIKNVGMNPTRTGLLQILRAMGGKIEVEEPRFAGKEPVADLRVHASELSGIKVPEELVPLAIDEFPVLFVAAACAHGETLVTGAEELRVKESDRIAAMSEGFKALKTEHEVLPDGMRIAGSAGAPAFGGGRVDSDGDHRIAMAFSIASLKAKGPILIDDVANVATSFPGFASLACTVGLKLEESSAA